MVTVIHKMKPSVKVVPQRAARKRPSRSAKVVDKDLAQLAVALESGKGLKLTPPEPQKPQHDPKMWSSLFGMWS